MHHTEAYILFFFFFLYRIRAQVGEKKDEI